ncbi:MAG: hypothetical protein NT092_03690 [Bacteroidia bacterium]|nr:hypothetical protein [Bacteroidia bacterium]
MKINILIPCLTGKYFTYTPAGDNLNEMQEYLKQCNAFSEHTEARLKIIPR